MKFRKILLIVILIICITGCKKKKEETLKFIELEENKNVNIVTLLSKDNKEQYIENRGFKNSPGNVIIVRDKDDNLVEISNNPEEYNVGPEKDERKYYQLRIRPFNIKFSNQFENKEDITKYECYMRIEINEPIVFNGENEIKNMSIEDFYNTFIKNLINEYLNSSIEKILVVQNNNKYIDTGRLNAEFNSLIQEKTSSKGYIININNIRILEENEEKNK